MAQLDLTNIANASIATPASGVTSIFTDTADLRQKVKDQNGVMSVLNNDGMHDRNVLINGAFMVQQRQVAASTAIAGVSTTTRAGQVSDRWAVTTSVASNLNWQLVDTAGAQDANLQSRYYGSIISSTAGKKVMLSQWVIGSSMAHLRGKKVRVSLKHNQKVGSGQTYKLGLLQLGVAGTTDVSPAFLTGAWSTVTGTDPAWGTNLAAITPDAAPVGEGGTITGAYLNVTTVATTWTKSSCVFTVPTNAKNLVVVFFSDTTGGATDNISIAEFQLTEGVDLVDYVPEPLSLEVLRCQRFFAKSFPYGVLPAASVAVATGGYGATFILGKTGSGTVLGSQIPIMFPVRMWKTPTVTLYTPTAAGAVVFRHSGVSPLSQGTTAVAANSTTDIGCYVTATNEATVNGAIGDLVSIHWSADAEIVA